MKPDKNKQLMLAAGSKSGQYDIEAPDQWKWVLQNCKDQTEKGMAWVKSKTTAYLHESPFCVDDAGNELEAQHMAAECGWTIGNAKNVLTELNRQGRIRIEKGKRIWYCADIPDAKPAEKGRTKGKTKSCVQMIWTTYQLDSIRNLSEDRQKQLNAKYTACLDWEKHLLADAIAAARNLTEQRKHTILQEYGVPKRRDEKKKRKPESLQLEIKLLSEPTFVHTPEPMSVQTSEKAAYEPKNRSVQSGPSFMSSAATTTEPQESLPSGEINKNLSSSSSVATRPAKPKPKEEERSLYKEFQNTYPKDHQDPKQKRLFEAKPRAAQALIIERLKTVWLNCPRWQDQDGRWIVSSVTFLTADYWTEEPPAALNQKKSAPANAKPSWDEMTEIIEKAKAAEKSAKAS